MPITTAQTVDTEQGDRCHETRTLEARGIVRNNVLWAMGVGVVPLPIIDLVGITAVQVKMLKKLSDHYEIPFMEHKVKNLVMSLIGGLGSVGVGSAIIFSVVKLIPFAGHLAGAIAIPVAGGALTHAIGKIFIQHFESGGTFLDFDPAAVRNHFREEFEKSKAVVQEMKAAADKDKK